MGLTGVVGHGWPGDVHGVEGDEGGLEQAWAGLSLLRRDGVGCVRYSTSLCHYNCFRNLSSLTRRSQLRTKVYSSLAHLLVYYRYYTMTAGISKLRAGAETSNVSLLPELWAEWPRQRQWCRIWSSGWWRPCALCSHQVECKTRRKAPRQQRPENRRRRWKKAELQEKQKANALDNQVKADLKTDQYQFV